MSDTLVSSPFLLLHLWALASLALSVPLSTSDLPGQADPEFYRDIVSRKVPSNAIQSMLLRPMNATLLSLSQWYPNYKSGYRGEENICKEISKMLFRSSQEEAW